MSFGVPAEPGEDIAFALVVAFVSTLSVVLGELVPKSLALRYSERFTIFVSRPLDALSQVARPVVWFLTKASNVVLRPFRDRTNFTEARLSIEELQQLVGEAAASGAVDRQTGEIASRAIDMARLKASAVMVPSRDIAWLPLDGTRETILHVLRETPHARYPVRDGSSKPLGYVLTHEIYDQLIDGALDVQRLLREIPTFPRTTPAVEILRALQRARSEIGLIVDERDAIMGLVSIETLAEELFGEIASENERLEI